MRGGGMLCHECNERPRDAPDGRCEQCYFDGMMMDDLLQEVHEDLERDERIRNEYWNDLWREREGIE